MPWLRLTIRTVNLPETKRTALIIPVPDLKRCNPKPVFGDFTAHTWALVHGTTAPGATAIFFEGIIRPADWEHNDDPRRSQLPTVGLFGIGSENSRSDMEIPSWAETRSLSREWSRRVKNMLLLTRPMSTTWFVAVTWHDLAPINTRETGDDDSDNVNDRNPGTDGRHPITHLTLTNVLILPGHRLFFLG